MGLMQVGAVNTRSRDLDQNFTIAGRGLGDFFQCQTIVRAGIFQRDCLHGSTCQLG